MIELAYEIARDAHDGQLRGETPFIEHPASAAEVAERLGFPDIVIVGCYLHDVIEKGNVTLQELRDYEFPEVLVLAIEAVTYTDEDKEKGIDKIEKAKYSPLSHAIKFCDSTTNLEKTINSTHEKIDKKIEKLAKFRGYLTELSKNRPSPNEVKQYVNEFSASQEQSN